jgi:hypothetical protein
MARQAAGVIHADFERGFIKARLWHTMICPLRLRRGSQKPEAEAEAL